MAAEETQSEFQINSEQLYQEEVFTDRRVGSILRLTPVTPDGARDARRVVVFLGQTQVLTQAGALPINFEIKADSLEQAVAQYERAAEEAHRERWGGGPPEDPPERGQWSGAQAEDPSDQDN